MQARTKAEMKRLDARVRAVCLTALRRLANKHGLKVVKASNKAAAQIGAMMGFNGRAGYGVLGERGYISSVPHGDDFHTAFTPGHGKDRDWKRFFTRPCLSYVQGFPELQGQGPLGDNFSPQDRGEVDGVLKACGLNIYVAKPASEWAAYKQGSHSKTIPTVKVKFIGGKPRVQDLGRIRVRFAKPE